MMSYQYARLAVGRKNKFRGAWVAVPCDSEGTPLPSLSDNDELFRYGTKRVTDYRIENGVLLCYLNIDP